MKLARFLLPTALFAAALTLPARAETHVSLSFQVGVPAPVIVEQAPPRPVVETAVVWPGPGYVWVAGHYTWKHHRWAWTPGAWVHPPQPGTFWVEGRWDERTRNWIEGHWEIVPSPASPVVVVEAPPPPPRQEIIVARPSPQHVWIDGYWVWHGHRHEWMAGHWERPPPGRRVWVAPRWEHHGHSYVFVEGCWR